MADLRRRRSPPYGVDANLGTAFAAARGAGELIMSENLLGVGWEIIGAVLAATFFVIDGLAAEAAVARRVAAARKPPAT
jgi:hypothetical protein